MGFLPAAVGTAIIQCNIIGKKGRLLSTKTVNIPCHFKISLVVGVIAKKQQTNVPQKKRQNCTGIILIKTILVVAYKVQLTA